MSLNDEIIIMQGAGVPDSEIQAFRQENIAIMSGAGMSAEQIATEFGRPSQYATPTPATTAEMPSEELSQSPSEFVDSEFGQPVTATREIESYWRNVLKEVKEWSVGEKAEWGEYLDRGFGKSTTNLVLQYHTKGEVGVDAQMALSPEPEDTGHLERWLETMSMIGGDMPVFIPAAIGGTTATGGNVFAGGFAAGFVNESIKSMYIDALERGETSSYKDWWDSFVDHGFKEGLKSGLILGTGAAAPGWIGAKSLVGKYATQYAAFTGAGALIEQRMPTSDELINTGLVLGTFGAFEGVPRAKRMFMERAKKTDKSPVEVLQEVELNPRMKEDLASTNQERFRDPIEPTEAIQPFKEGSNPKRETPDVLYEVRPEDLINLRNSEAINAEKYNTARESGLEPPAAVEFARIETAPKDIPVSDAVNAVVNRVEFEVPKNRESMSDVRSKFTTMWIDRLHPVLKAVRNFEEKGGSFDSKVTPYQQMRLQPGMIGRGMHFLQHGTLDFATLKPNGPGLMKIMETVKTDKEVKEFTAFAIAKRAVEKAEQGKETGVPLAEARATVVELANKDRGNQPTFNEIFRELNEFQKRSVQFLVDSGVFSKEAATAVFEANRDYVPFYRVMDETVKMASGNFSKAVRNPMKRFKGSEAKIQDPLTSIHLNTLTNVAIAERNLAYVKFIEMVEKLPEAFPEVQRVTKAKGTKITKEELEAAFDSPIKPEFADGMTVFRRGGQIVNEAAGEIGVYRNGKQEVWSVGPEIATALKDMNRLQSSLFMQFIGTPSRLLRAGATLAPDFMVRNLTRDAFTAGVLSNRNFVPMYHNAMGFWHMINKTELYKEWTSSGAMQSMLVSFDRNYFKTDMKKQLTSGTMRNVITNPLEALRAASEFFESSGRIGQYSLAVQALKKNRKLTSRDVIEKAGFESRDITIDFSKMGTTMQGLNMISAFFNARVQGYAKIYEAYQQRPLQTSAKVFAYITLPSILLHMKNHDDPRYLDLPQWQKDLAWIVITGDGTIDEPNDYTVWRIPKPFELGVLFGTGAERMMDFAYSKDPEHMQRFFLETFKDAALSMGPIPDFAKPFVEFWANKNLFNDRTIVPRGMENMLPEFQYDNYTSASAKVLGKLINEISIFTDTAAASPAKIDHLIKSWTGTLGRYAIEAADKALVESGAVVQPTKPEPTLEDLPVIRAFLVRKPSGSAQPIQDFYRKYDKIGGRMKTIEKLQKENRMEDAKRVLSQTDLRLVPLLGYKNSMSNISRTIRLIHAGPAEPKEKRQMIDQLYLTMIEIAKSGLKSLETMPE